MSTPQAEWDFPRPHVIAVDVTEGDIDEYQHVNNAVYLTWLDLEPTRDRSFLTGTVAKPDQVIQEKSVRHSDPRHSGMTIAFTTCDQVQHRVTALQQRINHKLAERDE